MRQPQRILESNKKENFPEIRDSISPMKKEGRGNDEIDEISGSITDIVLDGKHFGERNENRQSSALIMGRRTQQKQFTNAIHRTYESSSDEENFDKMDLISDRPGSHSDDEEQVDVKELRRDMMSNAPPNSPILFVEKKSVGHKSFRHSLLKGLKEKLRKPDVSKDRADVSIRQSLMSDIFPTSTSSKVTTPCLDHNELAMEQSKLEKESRRITRKPLRSTVDDSRLQTIANRLSRISSLLAENPYLAQETKEVDFVGKKDESKRNFFSEPENCEVLKVIPREELRKFELGCKSDVTEASTMNTQTSRRRKGWATFETGVSSFQGRSKTKPVNAHSTKDFLENGTGSLSMDTEGTDKLRENASINNPKRTTVNTRKPKSLSQKTVQIDETCIRLEKRKVQLRITGDGFGQMTTDASRMLGAARALKYKTKNNKNNFFS